MILKFLKITSVLCVVTSMLCKGQDVGVGGSILGNIHTKSSGASIRATLFPDKRLCLVPQFTYYFPFGASPDLYPGLGVEFKLTQTERAWYYTLAHATYNYRPSLIDIPFNLSLGIGVAGLKDVRPFAECRYSINLEEVQLQVGLLYVFNEKRHLTLAGTRGYKRRHNQVYTHWNAW